MPQPFSLHIFTRKIYALLVWSAFLYYVFTLWASLRGSAQTNIYFDRNLSKAVGVNLFSFAERKTKNKVNEMDSSEYELHYFYSCAVQISIKIN